MATELKRVLKCAGCGERFARENIIFYTSPGATKQRAYCSQCYQEKLTRERFREAILKMFPVQKVPPTLWRERLTWMERGFTSDAILEAIRYLHDEKNIDGIPAVVHNLTTSLIQEAAIRVAEKEQAQEQVQK